MTRDPGELDDELTQHVAGMLRGYGKGQQAAKPAGEGQQGGRKQ